VKLSLLPLLACPGCGGSLSFSRLEAMPRDGEDLRDGALGCKACSKEYPIVEGIPRLFADPELEASRERTVLRGEVPSPLHPPSGCVFHPRCPVAVARCRDEVPELREIKPGHWAACFLA